jgi:hypothetical protein
MPSVPCTITLARRVHNLTCFVDRAGPDRVWFPTLSVRRLAPVGAPDLPPLAGR